MTKRQIILLKLIKNCFEGEIEYDDGRKRYVTKFELDGYQEKVIKDAYVTEKIETDNSYTTITEIRNEFVDYCKNNTFDYNDLISGMSVMYKTF